MPPPDMNSPGPDQGLEIELQIGVSGRDLLQRPNRLLRKWSSAQIRMQQDAGCIHDGTKATPDQDPGLFQHFFLDPLPRLRFRPFPSQDLRPLTIQHGPDGLAKGPPGEVPFPFGTLDSRPLQDLVNGRQVPQDRLGCVWLVPHRTRNPLWYSSPFADGSSGLLHVPFILIASMKNHKSVTLRHPKGTPERPSAHGLSLPFPRGLSRIDGQTRTPRDP